MATSSGAARSSNRATGLEFNRDVARQFGQVADLLEAQDAEPRRVNAYRRAADTLDEMSEPASDIYRREGVHGLEDVPTIGRALARAIAEIIETGRWRWLDRLRGEVAPEDVLATVAGIGPELAERIHEQLDIETLEELEAAAHDGRLATVGGFGSKRIRSVIDSLAGRLQYRRHRQAFDPPPDDRPPAEDLLDVDREYRRKANAGALPRIAPRRFNPDGERWLPILHTSRGDRHYTALYSNSARAHQRGRTRDWVVIYEEEPGHGQWTVASDSPGPSGVRVVRGR